MVSKFHEITRTALLHAVHCGKMRANITRSMAENILIMLAGLVVLGIAAHYLVMASVKLAELLGVSEAFIGLTIVAAGTSAPEIAVSVVAALNGQGSLSVGNVIGSNIFNLGFILGVVAIIAPQHINKKMVYRDGTVLLLSTLLIFVMMWNQFVSFREGVILLVFLVAYNTYLWVKRDIPEVEEETKKGKAKWTDAIVFLVSLIFLIKAADYVVESAVYIAQSFGISEWAIGATIVAAGTSLPEIATSIMATIKRKFDLSVGNVVGSDIFNVLGIIGVSAVIAPLSLNPQNFLFGFADNIVSVGMLVLTILLVLIFMRSGWKISRTEGVILLVISIARMWFEIAV